MERVQRLLDKRIIREITPIFDTRALGYSSMLVAAKVDPEYPHRAAQGHQHPPRRHAQLPAQPRLQPVVHDRHRAGLEARAPGHARRARSDLTGAESIRQLPTLKLFKIRMDLEMEKGTDALSAAGEAVEPLELEPIELSDEDIATIRATQGQMPVVAEPYAPAAERLGIDQDEVLARLESLRERGGLRRVAAILYHRRAGFSANGMGVWKVPEGAGARDRAADGRVPRHLALLPAARPTPTGRTRSSRWPTGARRRSATRSSTRSPRRPGIEERATLYSSTEFKKVRMLYFTDDFRRWEEEHAS